MEQKDILTKVTDKLGLLITDIGGCERIEQDMDVCIDNLEQEILEILEELYSQVPNADTITKNYCLQRMSELW